MSDLIKKLIRQQVQELTAYTAPTGRYQIKLDAMENPYQLPSYLRQNWLEHIKDSKLNRYPDAHAANLKQKLASMMDVPNSCAVMLGNGSDEIIQIIMMALARPGAKVLTVEPGFSMYKIIAATAGLDYLKVELNDDFSLNEEAMLTAMAEHQPELVFIANPNNPSGNLFDRATLETIIDKAPGLVVIDEAYSSFASESLMSNLPKFSHKMLVMRTLSKSGLAGLRLGMLTGSTAWINEFNKIRLPYNINTLTQKSVEFMLNNYYVLQRQADKIKQERARLYAALTDIEDITAYPSEANFILFRTAVGTADAIHQKLKKSGILIKNLNGSHPLLNDCLRVSIGTTKENDIFMRQLTTL